MGEYAGGKGSDERGACPEVHGPSGLRAPGKPGNRAASGPAAAIQINRRRNIANSPLARSWFSEWPHERRASANQRRLDSPRKFSKLRREPPFAVLRQFFWYRQLRACLQLYRKGGMKNALYYGDNRAITISTSNIARSGTRRLTSPISIRHSMQSATITKSTNIGGEDRAQAHAFTDTWVWDD